MSARRPTPERPPTPRLSGRKILDFLTPLVLTSQLMTLAGPIMNVAIGRAPEPKIEIAGYWIGFTIVFFLGSACLVLQQITAALVEDRPTGRRLALAGLLLGGGASLMTLAVAMTPLGDLVFQRLIPTTPAVEKTARAVLTLLSPAPLLVAAREVANGLAIREHRTSLVAAGTLIRVVALAIAVASLVAGRGATGAVSTAWAFLAGLTIEAVFLAIATRSHWRDWFRADPPGEHGVSYGGIARVGGPLVAAAFVWTSTRPAIHAVLGRLPDSDLAQAGFGVVLPLMLASYAPLWALHQASLVLPREQGDLTRILVLAGRLAIGLALVIGLVAVTPLGPLVLRLGFGLSPELERAVTPALPLLALGPFLVSARAIAQGLLMRARRTGAFLILSPLKILLMIAMGILIAARWPNVNGVVLGVSLFLGGDLFDALLYGMRVRSLIGSGEILPGRAR